MRCRFDMVIYPIVFICAYENLHPIHKKQAAMLIGTPRSADCSLLMRYITDHSENTNRHYRLALHLLVITVLLKYMCNNNAKIVDEGKKTATGLSRLEQICSFIIAILQRLYKYFPTFLLTHITFREMSMCKSMCKSDKISTHYYAF